MAPCHLQHNGSFSAATLRYTWVSILISTLPRPRLPITAVAPFRLAPDAVVYRAFVPLHLHPPPPQDRQYICCRVPILLVVTLLGFGTVPLHSEEDCLCDAVHIIYAFSMLERLPYFNPQIMYTPPHENPRPFIHTTYNIRHACAPTRCQRSNDFWKRNVTMRKPPPLLHLNPLPTTRNAITARPLYHTPPPRPAPAPAPAPRTPMQEASSSSPSV